MALLSSCYLLSTLLLPAPWASGWMRGWMRGGANFSARSPRSVGGSIKWVSGCARSPGRGGLRIAMAWSEERGGNQGSGRVTSRDGAMLMAPSTPSFYREARQPSIGGGSAGSGETRSEYGVRRERGHQGNRTECVFVNTYSFSCGIGCDCVSRFRKRMLLGLPRPRNSA
jgi:hypothetical protein